MNSVICKCRWCGVILPQTHTGPCTKCGKQGKICSVVLEETISLSDSLESEFRREFYEKNPKFILITAMLIIISSFSGFFLPLVPSAIISLLAGILSYFLGPYASIKVRLIKKYINQKK